MIRERRTLSAYVAPAAVVLTALATPDAGVAQFVVTANSGSAFADAQSSETWFPPQRNERFYGPLGGAAVGELDLRNFGHLRGVQTDYGLNAVRVEGHPGDMRSFSFGAGTKIDLTVENAAPITSGPLIFEYTINGGQLRLNSAGGSFDGLIASVSVSIFTIAPGRSGFLWSWTQSLRGQSGSVNTSTDFFLDPLGFGMPAMSPITRVGDEAFIDIGAFHRSADLGRLSPGGTAFITYDMDAHVSGPGFGPGGVAALGDPFNLNGAPGSILAIPGASLVPGVTAAPEPATLGLTAVGLTALALARRRRRQGTDTARTGDDGPAIPTASSMNA
jgi:hypothetical protein